MSGKGRLPNYQEASQKQNSYYDQRGYNTSQPPAQWHQSPGHQSPGQYRGQPQYQGQYHQGQYYQAQGPPQVHQHYYPQQQQGYYYQQQPVYVQRPYQSTGVDTAGMCCAGLLGGALLGLCLF